MPLRFEQTIRHTWLDALTSRVGNAGIVRIYDGSRPANVATAPTTQVVLAELTMGTPMAPAASSNTLTLNAITQDSSANASGTASWFRVFQSNGTTAIFDGDVGTSGSDMNLNTVAIVAGGPVQITSWTITAPGA